MRLLILQMVVPILLWGLVNLVAGCDELRMERSAISVGLILIPAILGRLLGLWADHKSASNQIAVAMASMLLRLGSSVLIVWWISRNPDWSKSERIEFVSGALVTYLICLLVETMAFQKQVSQND
jgi:hypothetical protein